jgi:Ca-activated chloride channel homolog
MPIDLHFLRPHWFIALLPLALLIAALWRGVAQATVWRGLVDAHLLPHLLVGADGGPRRLPLMALAAAWVTAVTALAGPVWERLPQPVFGTSAKRVILLDLSPSMNAADLPPSRLARARFEVLDLLDATREGQVALIAFGPDPYIVSPLTGDAQTIAGQVPRLTSDLIPVPGPRRTERALEQAGALLAQAGATGGDVILITDGLTAGGADLGTPVNAAARALAAAGHRLSILGVGTTQGAPVPGPQGSFAPTGGGSIALSRLDRAGLTTLAAAGGGRYVDLDAGDADTRALTAAAVAPTPGELVEQPGLAADQWREEGPWLLLALLPVAALAFRRGWLLSAVLLVLVLPPREGAAFGWADLWQRPDQQAAGRFAAGDHAAAAARFEDPAWRAAAQYRAGDYAGSLADLAGLAGPEADYNRGNALARLGRFDEAIAAYEQTLAQAPDHADARANLEQVRRLRDRQGEHQPPPDQGQHGQHGQQGDQDSRDQPGPSGSQNQQTGGQDRQGQSDQPNGQGAQDASAGAQHGKGQDQGASPGQATDGQQNAPPQSGEQAGTDRREATATDAAEARSPADDATRQGGATPPPQAADLGAQGTEPEATLADDAGRATEREARQTAAAPDAPGPGTPVAGPAGMDDLTPREREAQQAMEAQLRRVPDDPAGLLRQRFLLQQLRREGRLP